MYGEIDKWIHGYKVRGFKWIDNKNYYLHIEYYKPGQSLASPAAVEKSALIWFESGIVCRNVMVENVYRNERNVHTKAPTVRISENVQASNLCLKNIHNTFMGESQTSVENNSDIRIDPI